MDLIELTKKIINIKSISLDEKELADFIENYLKKIGFLEVLRKDNNVIARTDFKERSERVLLAGHLDTVPENGNLPLRLEDIENEAYILGLGSVDMKSAVAVFIKILEISEMLNKNITCVFYEAEEISKKYNGLNKFKENNYEILKSDLVILGEPTDNVLELGCQGSIRLSLNFQGKSAHTARSWKGINAIDKASEVVSYISKIGINDQEVDGLIYKEAISNVSFDAGIAGNVIPEEANLVINYRYAPNKNMVEAENYLYSKLQKFDNLISKKTILDHSPAGKPFRSNVKIAKMIDFLKIPVRAKYGWTDVARFSEANFPAINFGPGDPNLAHTKNENIKIENIKTYYNDLVSFLSD